MSYEPATHRQVAFLGSLMLRAGDGTPDEVAEYQGNLVRLSALDDPYASRAYVGELIDHKLDQLSLGIRLQRLNEEILSGEWRLEEGATIEPDESCIFL